MAPSLDGFDAPPTLPYGSPTQRLSLEDLDWDDEWEGPTRLLPARLEIADDPTEVDVEPPAFTRSSAPPASAQVPAILDAPTAAPTTEPSSRTIDADRPKCNWTTSTVFLSVLQVRA